METDNEADAASVASRASGRSTSKPEAPPLPFPTTYCPESAPLRANDSMAKVADLLDHPVTVNKMSTHMTVMVAEANAASVPSTKLFTGDAIYRKVPINSTNKLVDKAPLQTPSTSLTKTRWLPPIPRLMPMALLLTMMIHLWTVRRPMILSREFYTSL